VPAEESVKGDRDEGGAGGAKDRGAFLGFVAHEVRNPLSTALWSAELLARLSAEERGGARGEKLTGMCMRSISRVRQLIEDHFLCERLDAGGLALRLEPVPAREVAETVLERRAKDQAPLSLDLGDGVTMQADRLLLDRALDALVAAAERDAAPVRVTMRAEGATVTVAVSGAPPLPDALRDPAKGSPSDQRGRALALPLARRIATALGGALEATPEGYALSLPRAGDYAPRPGAPANP
jgi:K+-sensing histidine kinase KdpD